MSEDGEEIFFKLIPGKYGKNIEPTQAERKHIFELFPKALERAIIKQEEIYAPVLFAGHPFILVVDPKDQTTGTLWEAENFSSHFDSAIKAAGYTTRLRFGSDGKEIES